MAHRRLNTLGMPAESRSGTPESNDSLLQSVSVSLALRVCVLM
jgi:hypothetical protein